MPTVHAPTLQPVQRISARTSSFWINGGHAPDAWDMNPSLVEEAQKQDSLATEPSDVGCPAADCLATCKKFGMKSSPLPFGGGSKKSLAVSAYVSWGVCPSLHCLAH